MLGIGRREFITALGGGAAWPLAARAQQPTMPVIGYLAPTSLGGGLRTRGEAVFLPAYLQGLKETGFVEGENVKIEYRSAEGRNDHLPALAADLVSRRVAVIAVPGGLPSALAAKAATQTIPIVFNMGSNAVETGLVASYNRPGRNLTGVVLFSYELIAKRLQLLHEMVQVATSIALIANPTNPGTHFK